MTEVADAGLEDQCGGISDEAPVAAPPQGFGAPDGRRPRAGRRRWAHPGRLEARTWSCSRRSRGTTGRKGHVWRAYIGATELGETTLPAVAEASGRQPLIESVAGEVRVVATARGAAHVDDQLCALPSEQAGKPLPLMVPWPTVRSCTPAPVVRSPGCGEEPRRGASSRDPRRREPAQDLLGVRVRRKDRIEDSLDAAI